MTRRAIVETVVERERASATPVVRWRLPGTTSAPAIAPDAPPDDGSLRARQEWFARAVMSPETAAAPSASDADRVLTPGPRLSCLERLEVYRHAYHLRLIECLADDYPALQAAVGEPAFDRMARAYIALYPSTSPNLNAYGRRMSEWCRVQESFESIAPRAFLADLATLEWAIVEVIHAASTEPLTLSGLRDVPVERWVDARMTTTPAFRLLRFVYPVNTYFQAFREGKSQAIPDRCASAAAVYRSGPTVWRMDLSDPMFDLLNGLWGGATLGTSLERAAAGFGDLSEEVAVARVMAWFREWVSSGLFSGVSFG